MLFVSTAYPGLNLRGVINAMKRTHLAQADRSHKKTLRFYMCSPVQHGYLSQNGYSRYPSNEGLSSSNVQRRSGRPQVDNQQTHLQQLAAEVSLAANNATNIPQILTANVSRKY